MKAIFKYLLACNYNFARRWVNPNYGGDVMWTTIYAFLTPISFVAAALYAIAIFFLNNGNRLDSPYAYSIPVFLIIVGIGYGLKNLQKMPYLNGVLKRNSNRYQRNNVAKGIG